MRTYTRAHVAIASAVAYSLAMIGLLVMSFQAARSFLGLKLREILYRNTDEIVYQTARDRPRAGAEPMVEPVG